jgi:hypothetical protein
MIYRILVDELDEGLNFMLSLRHPNPVIAAILADLQTSWRAEAVRKLRGVNTFGAQMDQKGLRRRRISNKRARFYFTELGWRKVGRFVAAEAKRTGRVVKVIRRKQPDRSQIVYQDELQLAVLRRSNRFHGVALLTRSPTAD